MNLQKRCMNTMSSEFYFINTSELFYDNFIINKYPERTDLKNFGSFMYLFGKSVFDRTGTIISPFNLKLMPTLELPSYQTVGYDYAYCCDKRAKELLELADLKDKNLCVFYSGGVDSTCIVASLLKNSTDKQKKRISVLMSYESYTENPTFYNDFIIGKLDIVESSRLPLILGNDNYICVTGEGNDQLFGAWMFYMLTIEHGNKFVECQVTPETLFDYLHNVKNSERQTENYVNLLLKVMDKCPVKIDSMHKFFWWSNLTQKWQCVYNRLISFADKKNWNTMRPEENYFMFYNTKEFQLWSMNNTDKLFGTTLKTYKSICRDYIFQYDRNLEYRNKKRKIGSLARVTPNKKMAMTIDSDMIYSDKTPLLETIYNPNNSFNF